MSRPLSRILVKVFAAGFYQVHAGILFFIFFVMIGCVPGNMLVTYHKSLMIALTSSPVMLTLVFAVWLIYIIKSWHFVTRQLLAGDKLFLFYSSNALQHSRQAWAWSCAQAVIMLPVLTYGLLAVAVGLSNHYYALPILIILFFVLTIWISSIIYMRTLNKLVDGGKQSILLKLTRKWHKPYFSLFIYHVFDKLKISYIIAKTLSWLIVTGVFYLFADVKTDQRLAGIAMLAILTTHMILVFEIRRFEETRLSFSRNLPYSMWKRFGSFIGTYFLLLLPEVVWLFSRFNLLLAFELLLTALSIAMLYHSILYYLGLNMDKYIQWTLGLFMVLFWVIMFRLLWVLVPVNTVLAYLFFYHDYYKYDDLKIKTE